MPTYQYECPKCKRVIELEKKIDERILSPMCCEPGCNIDMELIISKTSFSLKGERWARDGYAGAKK